jgi:hypothetical protein
MSRADAYRRSGHIVPGGISDQQRGRARRAARRVGAHRAQRTRATCGLVERHSCMCTCVVSLSLRHMTERDCACQVRRSVSRSRQFAVAAGTLALRVYAAVLRSPYNYSARWRARLIVPSTSPTTPSSRALWRVTRSRVRVPAAAARRALSRTSRRRAVSYQTLLPTSSDASTLAAIG